ncbi:MAG: hypothetical protein ACKVG4_00805 [Longimicrobiales bacterium]|jgi:hypothetical protein|tara:strand:+ start:1222 stop:1731 length:510 start_codon:yes stop_codon:yes gene_type:complete
MPRVEFAELPGHGRLWVFPATGDLTEEQVERFSDAVDDFLDGWAAHGVPLVCSRDLLDKRFLLVGVDVDAEAPSGCSIDALVRELRALGAQMGVSLIDHAPIWYRTDDGVSSLSRADFRALAESGAIGPDTRVFDTTLTKIGAFRDGLFERAASETWHGKAFFRDRLPV